MKIDTWDILVFGSIAAASIGMASWTGVAAAGLLTAGIMLYLVGLATLIRRR